MTRVVALCLSLLAACETAGSTPIAPTPAPPPPPTPPPPAPPPAAVDLQCSVNGPKEYRRIKTDPATMKGLLELMTTGPVPDRRIRYVARAAGPQAYDLVFAGYEPGDYQRFPGYRPTRPREKLELGKSVIARVYVENGASYLRGQDVDLHTGMHIQYPDNAAPCDTPRP